MLSHADESRLRELFSEALMLICRNTISFESQLAVKALIALTIDGEEVTSIDCNNVLLKKEHIHRKLNAHTGRHTTKEVVNVSDGRKSNYDTISIKRAKADSRQQQNMAALYSDVEHLAKNYEHKVMKIGGSSQAIVSNADNLGKHSASAIGKAEHAYATHAGEEAYDEDEAEPMTETNSLLVDLHKASPQAEVFLPNDAHQDWSLGEGQQQGVSLSTFEDDSRGMVQTVIVGGGGEEMMLGHEEEVLVMTGMETDDASALQLMQPGETFEFNGITYQIAATDDMTGEHSEKIKQEKTGPIKMNKGNHTKSKKPKKFLCSLCSHWFSSHWGLKIHEKLHKGQFRYHCKICSKGFTSSVNLRGHMVKHSQQKEFSCEYCGKAFVYRQSLERHQAKKGDAPCSGLRRRAGAGRKPLTPKPPANVVRAQVTDNSIPGFNKRS